MTSTHWLVLYFVPGLLSVAWLFFRNGWPTRYLLADPHWWTGMAVTVAFWWIVMPWLLIQERRCLKGLR